MSAYVTMQVGAVLIHGFDWNDGFLDTGETLSTSSWAVGPSTGAGATLSGATATTTETQVKVTAVSRGHYVVTNTVTTSAGQTGKQSIEIRVTDSP